MNNRQIAQRYAEAAEEKDLTTLAQLASPDIEVRYPQSGEVIRGRDNYVAMLENYPGGLGDLELSETLGTKERVTVQTPSFGMPVITVTGNDTTFFFEGFAEYPNGGRFHTAGYIEVQNMSIIRETTYFAEPFDAPAWRQPYVEDTP